MLKIGYHNKWLLMNAILSHKFQMYCLAQAKHQNNSEFQKKPERNRTQRQMDL